MGLIKTTKEIQKISFASYVVAHTLNELKRMVKPGITTMDLEVKAQEILREANLKASFEGYAPLGDPYPAALCTSVNNEVGHVPPSDKVLKEGDLLSIDFGVIYQGYHGDSAVTIIVGDYLSASREARKVMHVCDQALYAGIQVARAGYTLDAIGCAIEAVADDYHYEVCRTVSGHGIGTSLHEEPMVFHYKDSVTKDFLLREGMTICIEPMVCVGSADLDVEGWPLLTKDGSLSAHFEHTILITDGGPRILTSVFGSH